MLKVKGLVKRFNRGASEIAALNGVNLHLKPESLSPLLAVTGQASQPCLMLLPVFTQWIVGTLYSTMRRLPIVQSIGGPVTWVGSSRTRLQELPPT